MNSSAYSACWSQYACSADPQEINMSSTFVSGRRRRPMVAPVWREIQGASDWEGLLDPAMDDTLRSEVIRYGELTQVCYDSFDSALESKYRGRCKYSRAELLERVGMGDCGYKVTKYLYATPAVTPFPGVVIFPSTDVDDQSRPPDIQALLQSNWMGYVAVCDSWEEMERLGRRDIVVCWRGTVTSTEWAEDFRDVLVPVRGKLGGDGDITTDEVKVEQGFLELYTTPGRGSLPSARDQLRKEIWRLLEEYKDEAQQMSITVAGHSLGGALAVVSAYDLALTGINCISPGDVVIPITVFTFGSPRVGNSDFRHDCERLRGLKLLRFANDDDIVPKVPGVIANERFFRVCNSCLPLFDDAPWTYFHAGTLVLLDNKVSPYLQPTTNLHFRHNLEMYLHLIDGYTGAGLNQGFVPHGRDPALVNKYTALLLVKYNIPSYWWQDLNKGLRKNAQGMWSVPQRENDSDQED